MADVLGFTDYLGNFGDVERLPMLQHLKSKIRHAMLVSSGRYSHLKRGIIATKEWYGNSYGGFYVCPDFINSNSIVYSIGIGEDISFDMELIARHGCHVYGFDPTPKSIDWVRAQRKVPTQFSFHAYGLGEQSKSVPFYLPKNAEHISGSFIAQQNVDESRKVMVDLKALSDITCELGHNMIDVLKMDIEGGEYTVLASVLASPVEIGQILIEFHERFFDDGKARTINAVEQLKRSGFEIFAISANFEEVSFINVDLLSS